MGKRVSILSVLVLLSAVFFLFSGCSNKKVEESKEVIAEFYQNFEDNDVNGILDLFDDSLIDEMGGSESALIIIGSRIAVLGDDVEYDINSTSYNNDSGKVTVVLGVEATYGRDGETYAEDFQLEDIGGKMVITQISLQDEKTIEDFYDEFFHLYNETEYSELTDLFSDAFFLYATEDKLLSMIDNYFLAFGEMTGYEMEDEYYYCKTMAEENIVVVRERDYSVYFQQGSASFSIQVCEENGELKINYLFGYPDIIEETVDELFSYLEDIDYESAAGMYNDVFFLYTDGAKESWIEILGLMGGYGGYGGYEITNWVYYENELEDGTLLRGIVAAVNSQFGDTVFYNEITISIDSQNPGIIGHTIQISE